MKISQEVRDFAKLQPQPGQPEAAVIEIKRSLDDKAQEFREGGHEIYL
jgi:phosphomethylpyrimidine synthase